ncbi:hypothetical protein [Cohnella algarum]|uniref:hypothetical protein n=1 Tax=Cohnella algarum TaxID=2044859 RepID=UPI001F07C0CE|nr:hypothetical protein [Cohnella algarum]
MRQTIGALGSSAGFGFRAARSATIPASFGPSEGSDRATSSKNSGCTASPAVNVAKKGSA